MRQDDHMATVETRIQAPVGASADGSRGARRPGWSPRRFLDWIITTNDLLHPYHRGARAVSLSMGVGGVAGLGLGLPLWVGCLAGFLPAYLIAASYYVARA